MQKITFDAWKKTHKFQTLASRQTNDLGVEDKQFLDQLYTMAEWMQTPNAAHCRRHWDLIGISLHAPKGCNPHTITLQIGCRNCWTGSGFIYPCMDDNENTWGDGTGVEQRRRLKLIMQPYLDAMSGGSLMPLPEREGLQLSHTAATSPPQVPPPPPPEVPPTSSADSRVHRRKPKYRCHFADASRQLPIVTPTVRLTPVAEVWWPQAGYQRHSYYQHGQHGGWQYPYHCTSWHNCNGWQSHGWHGRGADLPWSSSGSSTGLPWSSSSTDLPWSSSSDGSEEWLS